MRSCRSLALLLALTALAACGEDQPLTAPTAATTPDQPALSHTAGHRVVNSAADPGDGVCNAAECTLREAIADPGSTEITFAAGLAGPITLARPSDGGGALEIGKTLSITGPSGRIAVRRRSTDPDFRIFTIEKSGTVTLRNLIIRGGRRDDEPGGGGIYNTGTLRVVNSLVAGNSAAMHGGGILNFLGTVTLVNSTVSDNASAEFGGGIDNNGATMTLVNSVVSRNAAPDGAGIFNIFGPLTLTDSRVSANSGSPAVANEGETAELTITRGEILENAGGGVRNVAGTLRITRSTVAGNTAGATGGGGIENGSGGVTLVATTVSGNSGDVGGIRNHNGGVDLVNSTVSGNSGTTAGGILSGGAAARLKLRSTTVALNSSSTEGGGISTAGPVTLVNSIVALNTAPARPDLRKASGVTVAARFSLLGIGNGSGVGDGVNGNQVGSLSQPLDPRLGPLAENGGPTRTHALLAGSPAIDAASTSDCPPTDQRGVARPQGAGCDVGSYERD